MDPKPPTDPLPFPLLCHHHLRQSHLSGPLASSSLPSTPAPPRKCLFLRLCPRRRVITANAFSPPSVVTVYTPLAN